MYSIRPFWGCEIGIQCQGFSVQVMAALVIPISSDSSKESVDPHVTRVILFGAIPAIIPVILEVPAEVPIVPTDPLVAPEVGAVSVTSPTEVLDLVDYSSSDSDPSKDSLPPAPDESEPAVQRPERHESLAIHDVLVSRWRDRVTSRPSSSSGSSSHDTFAPSYEFPVAPIIASLGIHRWPTILIRPGEAIPFGRPYRTHPNGPHRHSSSDFTSDSSSSGSSLDSSSDTSLGSPLDSLSGTSSVHSSGSSPPRYSEAFSRWRSAPLSTPYPPMASESFPESSFERSLDSSSLYAGPSRKRCRSPTTSVPSSTPVLRSIAPNHADLLPPCKSFRDSYSPKDSREEYMEIGTADVEAVADLRIGDGVGAHTEDGIGMGVDIAASDIREDEEEFEAEASARGTMEIAVDPLVTGGIYESTRGDVPDLEGTLYDIVHYMSEVPLDRITQFETAQRQLEAGQLMASGERAGLTDRIRKLGLENLKVQALCVSREIGLTVFVITWNFLRRSFVRFVGIMMMLRGDLGDWSRLLRGVWDFTLSLDMTITHSGMNPEAIEELIAQRVAEVLANYEVTRASNALEAKSQSQNGNDGNNGNSGNRNGNHGDGGNNKNGNPNENGRGAMPVARVCTYQDFMKCQPLNFKGTEGVVGLTRWFEKMETVFHISNCPEVYQVKYATCTLLDSVWIKQKSQGNGQKPGKHEHGERKSTKEAGDSKPKSKSQSSQSTLGQLRSKREGFYQSKGGKDNSSGQVHNGREKDVILIGKVKQKITRGLEKAQGMG
ncbi:hypothetical protein Tco_1245858 [Tanacetum coccineum]